MRSYASITIPPTLLLGATALAGDFSLSGDAEFESAAVGPYSDAHPWAQSEVQIQIEASGSGEMEVADLFCALDDSGSFSALYQSEAELDEDGAYLAQMSTSEAELFSELGCALSDLQIQSLEEVSIRAELEATVPNCRGYCAAKASAWAETECEGLSGRLELRCKGEHRAEYEASCRVACQEPDTYAIVAETSLSNAALLDLEEDGFSGAALGDLSAHLSFDHLEDASGGEVSETP